MRRHYLFYTLTALYFAPQITQACSQAHPVTAFIARNDLNGNASLDKEEWLRAQAGKNLQTTFEQGSPQLFEQLDKDQNGELTAREIGFQAVQYISEPCTRWNERIRLHRHGSIGSVSHHPTTGKTN